MAFIHVPVYFIEGDEEKAENLGLALETKDGEIAINTNLICAYNEMDNGNTMVRLANGDCIEVPLDVEGFEDILGEIESIYDLPAISSN